MTQGYESFAVNSGAVALCAELNKPAANCDLPRLVRSVMRELVGNLRR